LQGEHLLGDLREDVEIMGPRFGRIPSDQNVENKRLVGKRFEMESCKDWPRMPYPNGREWFHWPLMEIVERAITV